MAGRAQQSAWAVTWGSLFVASLILVGIQPAFAQLEGFNDLTGLNPQKVPDAEFTTSLTPANAKAGDEVTLSIDVKLPKGFYIYGTTGEFPGRTQIEIATYGLKPVDADFIPDRAAKMVMDPDLNVELSKFHDKVTWTRRFTVTDDPASAGVRGTLQGQYCSDGTEGPGVCRPIQPAFEFTAALQPPARTDYDITGKNSRLQFRLAPADARPGEKVKLSVTVTPEKGWHTYSTRPMGVGSEPTVIELLALRGLKPLGKGFQSDHEPKLESPDDEIKQEVYHEAVTWSRELEVLPETQPGQYGVRGALAHQVCKNTCVTFKTLFALGDLTDATPAAPEAPPARELPTVPGQKVAGAPNPDSSAADGVPAAALPQDQGLLTFLLTAIGFGLVSLLTPCVFPMVPITVSFFLKQSESKHHRPFTMALVFCGAIVATFTLLGVGIAAIFGATQLNALATNPWVNIFIGIVFFVFAFNMLGMFEIHIPSSLLTFTSNKEQAGGFLGVVFMALTFTLTSFTCTFAFAGSLLVAAAQGQYYWPILGMLAFGAAFASPFFILALIPSLLKNLPKSGGWMNAVKVVMGLIEIGAAVKFFSVADLGWNARPVIFDFTFVMSAWLILSLLIALYLLGMFRLPHDTPIQGISVARLILVMGFLGLGLNLGVMLLAPGREGNWITEQVLAMAPPQLEESHAAQPATVEGSGPELPQPTLSHHGIQFTLDIDKGIELAKSQNLPLFLDFTGLQCTNCRLMERRMARPVNRALLSKMVLVQLYNDDIPKPMDSAEERRLIRRSHELQTKFLGDVSLPTYVVVTPDGETVLAKYIGLEQRDGDFAKFLEAGLAQWERRKAPDVARR